MRNGIPLSRKFSKVEPSLRYHLEDCVTLCCIDLSWGEIGWTSYEHLLGYVQVLDRPRS
jgi:hypothetical protein